MICYHSSTKHSVFVLTETKLTDAIFNSDENLSPTVNRRSTLLANDVTS